MELEFNEQNLRKICNMNNVNCIVSAVTEDGKKYLEAIKADGTRVRLTDPQPQDKFPNQPINEIKKRLGYEFSSKFTTLFGQHAVNIYNFKCFEYRTVSKKETQLNVEFNKGAKQEIMMFKSLSTTGLEETTDKLAELIYALQKEKNNALTT